MGVLTPVRRNRFRQLCVISSLSLAGYVLAHSDGPDGEYTVLLVKDRLRSTNGDRWTGSSPDLGSLLSRAFPKRKRSSGTNAELLPVTVAGPCRYCTGLPY